MLEANRMSAQTNEEFDSRDYHDKLSAMKLTLSPFNADLEYSKDAQNNFDSIFKPELSSAQTYTP